MVGATHGACMQTCIMYHVTLLIMHYNVITQLNDFGSFLLPKMDPCFNRLWHVKSLA